MLMFVSSRNIFLDSFLRCIWIHKIELLSKFQLCYLNPIKSHKSSLNHLSKISYHIQNCMMFSIFPQDESPFFILPGTSLQELGSDESDGEEGEAILRFCCSRWAGKKCGCSSRNMEIDVFFQEKLGKSWDFQIFIQKKKGFEVTIIRKTLAKIWGILWI